MEGKSESPLPDKDPEVLAEEFADFFLDKITTINQDLAQYTPYTCEVKCPSCFQQFEPMTEAEVSKIIYNMGSKSCKLDAIQMTLLKQMLPDVIGAVTKTVNLLLTTKVFSQSLKIAAIYPLLKKLGLELTLKNLCFLSEVVKKCMLKKFIE